MKMNAMMLFKEKDIRFIEVDVPQISYNEVLIKNSYAGLCGTDLHIYDGEFPAKFPLIMGHEFSGIVEKVGKDVSSLKVGDHVVVNPIIGCNNCVNCKKNLHNYCLNRSVYGAETHGGFADYAVIKEFNAYKIDKSINLKEAALLEPLGCILNALKNININYWDKVLIFGAGSIGLLFLQIFNMMGISDITVIDINEKKLEIAKKLNAKNVLFNDANLDENINKISDRGFDILIDATGIQNIYNKLFKYSTSNARILFYGVAQDSTEIIIRPYQIYRESLSIYGTFSLTNNTFLSAISLLKNKKIDLSSLISYEFDLKDFIKAMNVLRNGEAIKIVFRL